MAHSPTSPSHFVTRHGRAHSPEASFGHETRFQWQGAQFVSDVAYKLPDTKMTKSAVFGTSARQGMDDENADAKKRSTGPGSYNIEHCYGFHSEYNKKPAYRFGGATRQSMDMKTPSPGAVYNTQEVYRTGKDKGIKISFNCDSRKPLYNESAASNADILWPKLPQGTAVSIGKRLKVKGLGHDTPGAVYEVHKIVNFKTGPAFSFGKSKASRFKGDKNDLGFDI